MANEDNIPSMDEIRSILAEMAANQKEEAKKNDRRAAENEKRAKENDRRAAENEQRAKENDRRAAENEKRAKENEHLIAKNAIAIEEMRTSSKSVDKQLKKLGKQIGRANNRWGKIIENLVAGDLTTIAREALGVHLSFVNTRTHPPDMSWEIDVLGTNQDAVVAVEVKTTLTTKDIDKFISNTMLPYTSLMPKHQRKKVYGIIAYVKVEEKKENEVLNHAWDKGLLVVKAMKGSCCVVENKNFTPCDYGSIDTSHFS